MIIVLSMKGLGAEGQKYASTCKCSQDIVHKYSVGNGILTTLGGDTRGWWIRVEDDGVESKLQLVVNLCRVG